MGPGITSATFELTGLFVEVFVDANCRLPDMIFFVHVDDFGAAADGESASVINGLIEAGELPVRALTCDQEREFSHDKAAIATTLPSLAVAIKRGLNVTAGAFSHAVRRLGLDLGFSPVGRARLPVHQACL